MKFNCRLTFREANPRNYREVVRLSTLVAHVRHYCNIDNNTNV